MAAIVGKNLHFFIYVVQIDCDLVSSVTIQLATSMRRSSFLAKCYARFVPMLASIISTLRTAFKLAELRLISL